MFESLRDDTASTPDRQPPGRPTGVDSTAAGDPGGLFEVVADGPTPFHVAAVVFLAAGLGLALYQGLQSFALVPRVSWITWTHVHVVTVGAFTQLLFGTLPRLAAVKLGRPTPSRWATWTAFAGLNGGLVLAWYGRAFGVPAAFDAGLAAIWALTAWLALTLFVMTLRSEEGRARDPTVGFYLLSPLAFLVGLALAFGLFGRVWGLPGGWYGLREAHVHANAWGFLGLAAVGTLFEAFPRFVGDGRSTLRVRRYAFPLFAAGIVALVVGPVLDMGRTVTAAGLALFASGYVLYVATLVQTYRRGAANATALTVLTAQAWILGPAAFAPFVLFGVPLGVSNAVIETAALHFFFLGWALPLAITGTALFLGGRPRTAGRDGDAVHREVSLPSFATPWTVALWNAAVLVVGLGFLLRNVSWAPLVQGPGYAALLALWGYYLLRIVAGGRPSGATRQPAR